MTNIEPGAQVVIELSYVETLRYDAGVFEFLFPMVVGPRYMPGRQPAGREPVGRQAPRRYPDASRISPPVALPGTRAGHDISMEVHIDAGVPVFELQSVLHAVDMAHSGPARARVALKNQAQIPNRDFILRYRTATDAIGDAFLTHTDARGTFFTLILQPPRVVRPEHAVPKELIFVIDRSGSMSGFPIGKAKETMRLAIERDPSMILQAKLAEPLRGLDERVANTGKEGNLTLGKLRVVNYRVDVMVYLRDTSPQAIDALKQLDFVQTGESNTTRLLIGSIDVRRLAELARLDVVIRIAPVVV